MKIYSNPKPSSYKEMLPHISIREACIALGIRLPSVDNTECFDSIDIDKPCAVCTTTWAMRKGAIAIIRKGGLDIDTAIKKQAGMIIGEQEYEGTNAYSARLPEGITPKEAYVRLCRRIRDKYDIPSIAIAGNAGKTTTKDLISSIFIRHMKTLCVQRNYNTWYTSGELLQNIDSEHRMYIQEAHESHADACSRIINPDAVVITNLERAHLDETGVSVEQSIRATLGITGSLKEGGAVFASNDCPYLAREKFEGLKVIRYSADSDDCDYYARDIENHFEYTKFTICSKGDEPIACTLNIAGRHNVANAVAAYAVGRYFGISPSNIVEALAEYRPVGVRQNLIKQDDRYILVDCYSTTILSSVATAKSLCELPVKPGGRRIIVLSYLPSLSSGSEEVHRDVGRQIAELPLDIIIGYRNDAKYIIDECVKAGRNAVFYQYHSEILDYLRSELTPNDTIAFKGVTYAHLEIIANTLFGLDIKPDNTIKNDISHNGGDF